MAESNQQQKQPSLVDVIQQCGGGAFHKEASEALAQLVKDMQRIAESRGGKPKGKLVLTINFALDRGIFDVDPQVKVTTPATIQARTIMYGTPDGRLTQNDTKQMALSLEAGAVREGMPDVKDIRSAPSVRT